MKEQKVDITLSDEVAEGVYSNLAIITHSNSEFIVDFVNILPGMQKGKVKSRIILAPNHAKRLLNALSDNIKRYESFHGPIKDIEEARPIPMNFGKSHGEA